MSAASSRTEWFASLPGGDDTIVAVATPPGRSAIAVVRVSGSAAHEIGRRILTPWCDRPRKTYLAALHHPIDSRLLDRALVTVFAGPRSYTGENMLEIGVHGGHVTPALSVGAVLAAGARLAQPGEFTRRAVANGKLDLLQAEAVADLVNADTAAMQTAALSQVNGTLSRRISVLREGILELEALIAYEIDFPEEDHGPVPEARVETAERTLLVALDELLATRRVAELARSGAPVVLAGGPNVGKSSLFNAMVGSARALVTDVPGTTRDALESLLDVTGLPVRLIDTAGLRDSTDPVEHLGIELAERRISEAAVVLVCGDASASMVRVMERVRRLVDSPLLAVRTKNDLCESSLTHDGLEALATREGVELIRTSARTGEGLSQLTTAIANLLRHQLSPEGMEVPLLTRERHGTAVSRARDEIVAFGRARRAGMPGVIAAVHLRSAVAALEELIGSVTSEDVLGRVFSSFCVGK